MDLIGVIAHHGYAVTGVTLFLAAIGIPLPMAITLLAAGAAAHGDLRIGGVLAVAVLAALAGDILLYFGGRYTGWWLLAWMCRVSVNPEACIFGSADYFYRRGPKTLLFAKYVPGLGAMAAPLAGSLNMRFARFLRLDVSGTLLYCASWLAVGYVFSRFIRDIAGWIERAGHAVLFVVLVLILGYAATVMIFTLRARRYKEIEKISAESLRERMQTLASESSDRLIIIADVRSHGYYDPGMQRIKNSIRVEPHRLKEELLALREFMTPECDVYVYCSCIRDTTSVRVAHMLQQENCHVQVIDGGLKAWIKAGGAMEVVPESDVHHLPHFD
ncbi:rhodanese-like domain-containing protein [Granulicella arctica]|uniref:Membrane protein DedA with SNARE-associated domain/rhodanese-related sulfurtransferase n=1 Tax=Granulicella arctica TaxID=940613 RepID=A0A7Y9TJX8_9BACT|nr:rhodanese-like domain-containing protein [Granulicella arctica]NYF78732.1 membrane protein DedA with SNARE-associated domain/rhodanese-related sulfurtransferase [Granulicella arctica]